jgi:hypothetical protein
MQIGMHNVFFNGREVRDTERRLKLSQEIHDFRLAPIHWANELPAKDAVAVDDVGFGKFECPVKAIGLLIGIADRKKIDFVIAQESTISILVHVDANSHDLHALIRHTVL